MSFPTYVVTYSQFLVSSLFVNFLYNWHIINDSGYTFSRFKTISNIISDFTCRNIHFLLLLLYVFYFRFDFFGSRIWQILLLHRLWKQSKGLDKVASRITVAVNLDEIWNSWFTEFITFAKILISYFSPKCPGGKTSIFFFNDITSHPMERHTDINSNSAGPAIGSSR